ncbi:hypothetical protein UA08_07031 [Talaromyces atroroseus]|uniref:Protein kinase domain-containing protein n=1 Tax=Talaromyces atroroseus TaxID=1441469 RepID=A0A225AVN5_TALAT|nr:hypothetical protein UA08_07031 [Talaromyces atroroseus]OKL57547.1 hypothetical protein UA08_07031 [Talaromyces atroroseus]
MNDSIPWQEKPPWDKYRRILSGFDPSVILAIDKTPRPNVFAVRCLSSEARTSVSNISRVKHQNIAKVYEVFVPHDALYVVTDYVPTSLSMILDCTLGPSPGQIAATFHQVVGGMKYLTSCDLACVCLQESDILVANSGHVTIGNNHPISSVYLRSLTASASFDNCYSYRHPGDVSVLSRTMVKAIQKRREGEGIWPGDYREVFEDLNEWSVTFNDFFFQTVLGVSWKGLSYHPFLTSAPGKEVLIPLVKIAQASGKFVMGGQWESTQWGV